MATAKSEYSVEDMLLEKLKSLGYDFIKLGNYDDVLTNFRTQICKLNSKALIEAKGTDTLTDTEFDRLVTHIDGHSIYDSAKILRDKWILPLDDGSNVYLEFLTTDNTRNIFQVSHQITMDPAHKDDVDYKNRYDVTVFINGLPLVQIELKKPGVDLNEAINQINRYRKYSFRGLFRYIQMFVVSNSTNTKYFANVNEVFPNGEPQNVLKTLAFYWTDFFNHRITKLIEFADSFFPRFAIMEMLTKYFVIKASEPILMVMRPYQIYAASSAYKRVMDSSKDGFIFHTTGSGKTLTAFKLATMLRDNPNVAKVFFMVDRSDLDDQSIEEYNNFETDCVDQSDSTKVLVKNIKDPNKKMIVTTIQKMTNAVKKPQHEATMNLIKNEKVVFIIDECHRSQFGKMHSIISRFFTDANYIGFTGTPIFKENKSADGRTTADIFNPKTDQLKACIHKYMIKEAIADGNVLSFSVEYLRTINKIVMSDGTEYENDHLEDPKFCKDHGIDIKKEYEDPARIKTVADDIFKNLERHTRPSGGDVYTALFATDRIANLMKYYHYMKENNPKDYKIAAIFSTQPNGDMDEGVDADSKANLEECMKDYNTMFGTNFDLTTFDAYRKDISKRMKQKELPQLDLLIVVDMFLTGFDSKPTNTLYLDKNLVWHTLVQAYSRTNRVAKRTKRFGHIVTYRDIKKAQDEALKLYSGDNNPNDYLLESYETYLGNYQEQVEQLRAVCETADDAANLINEDDQKAYVLAFRNVSHTLATLKTFTKFDWADLDPFLDDEEYQDYKSWYFEFHEKAKRDEREGNDNPLADIDFGIDLIRNDKVNVAYIMCLLGEANLADPEKKAQMVESILKDIDRSDNSKVYAKKQMIIDFIKNEYMQLPPGTDVTAAYAAYEQKHFDQFIYDFAEETSIKEDLVGEVVHEYFCNPAKLSKENLRRRLLDMHLGLVKTMKMIDKLYSFAGDAYDIFTTGEEND